MSKPYTIANAVTDALGSIPYGMAFQFRDFYRRVLSNLHINGNPSTPMDSTVSRIYRRFKKDFDVVLLDKRKSVWIRTRETLSTNR